MIDPGLTPWKKGDKFSARHLQESVDVLRRLSQITSGKGRTTSTPYGTTFDYDFPYVYHQFFMGIVQTSSLYTDERYVVKLAYPGQGNSNDAVVWNPEGSATDGTNQMYPTTFTATNLSEWVDRTHNVKDGAVVQLWPTYDRQNPPVIHWIFTLGGAGSGLPPGTGKFKVLQLIDDLNPGTPDWDWVRLK